MFVASNGQEPDTFPTARGEKIPMVGSVDLDAVINGVGMKVSSITNKIVGCARIEETGVP